MVIFTCWVRNTGLPVGRYLGTYLVITVGTVPGTYLRQVGTGTLVDECNIVADTYLAPKGVCYFQYIQLHLIIFQYWYTVVSNSIFR